MRRREVVWVVRPGDGARIEEVVARAGGDARAVREGRVFIARRRARANDPVRVGDEVRVVVAREPAAATDARDRDADGRGSSAGGARAKSAPEGSAAPRHAPGASAYASDAPIAILAREDDLVAVAKPAGIPTIPDLAGASHALVARVARQLGLDPGRLHPTSRLDREVSGVVVIALDAAARARLAAARAEGRYERRYVALAARAPSPAVGIWDAPIGRAADPRHRAAGGRDAAPAETRYRVHAEAGGRAILALAPVTGRTHQLRVHAAHAGAPLLGDRIYGGAAAGRIALPTGRVLALGRVALHALRVCVPRARGAPLVVVAPVPVELRALLGALGGDPDALEAAWREDADVRGGPA